MVRPEYPVNVKIFQKYVDVIDENLKEGKPLREAGFKSRAHFVRVAVAEKLKRMDLLKEQKEKGVCTISN